MIICICSKSGAGKNCLVNKIKEHGDYKELISYTTRPQREGESDDTYNFISEKEFMYMADNNEFIEYRVYETVKGKWHYGLAKHTVEEGLKGNNLVILDKGGLLQLKDYLKSIGKENELKSIYLHVDGKERLLRSLRREGEYMDDSQIEEVCRRFIADQKDFNGIENEVDYVLDNTYQLDLYENADVIIKLFKGEKLI